MTDDGIAAWRKLAKGPSDYDDRVWLESCCDALSNACDRIEAFEIRLKAAEEACEAAHDFLHIRNQPSQTGDEVVAAVKKMRRLLCNWRRARGEQG